MSRNLMTFQLFYHETKNYQSAVMRKHNEYLNKKICQEYDTWKTVTSKNIQIITINYTQKFYFRFEGVIPNSSGHFGQFSMFPPLFMNPGQVGLVSSRPGSARPGQLGRVNSAWYILYMSFCLVVALLN